MVETCTERFQRRETDTKGGINRERYRQGDKRRGNRGEGTPRDVRRSDGHGVDESTRFSRWSLGAQFSL